MVANHRSRIMVTIRDFGKERPIIRFNKKEEERIPMVSPLAVGPNR